MCCSSWKWRALSQPTTSLNMPYAQVSFTARYLMAFNARGEHLGEADIAGQLDTTKKEKGRTINIH